MIDLVKKTLTAAIEEHSCCYEYLSKFLKLYAYPSGEMFIEQEVAPICNDAMSDLQDIASKVPGYWVSVRVPSGEAWCLVTKKGTASYCTRGLNICESPIGHYQLSKKGPEAWNL